MTVAHAKRMALAIACLATLVWIALQELPPAPWVARAMGYASLILGVHAMMAGLGTNAR